MIVALPALIAVTMPFSSTVAMLSSLEVQVTLLSVASSGATVAVSLTVSSTTSSADVLSSVTPVTSIHS